MINYIVYIIYLESVNVMCIIRCVQFAGYYDEVLDVKFAGKNDSHLVVVTNRLVHDTPITF